MIPEKDQYAKCVTHADVAKVEACPLCLETERRAAMIEERRLRDANRELERAVIRRDKTIEHQRLLIDRARAEMDRLRRALDLRSPIGQ